MSKLNILLDDYLTTRRALGFKLQTEGTALRTFISFMKQRQTDYITTELALTWAQEPRSVQPTQWGRRLSFVRGLHQFSSQRLRHIFRWSLFFHREANGIFADSFDGIINFKCN